jgi:hypothetical protein
MKTIAATLVTRLPYAFEYDPAPILEAAKKVDERGLISISIPIHTENPNNGGVLIDRLEKEGLFLVGKVAWYRDRHIVTSKRRLTNTWEPLAIFAKTKKYIINRDAPAKTKKGYEHRETAFDEDEYLTCIGDHWAVRNDRVDRRWLPQTVVLNCAQLADIQPGDAILDPYGNPGVKKACDAFKWKYKDGGLPSDLRNPRGKAGK